MRFSDGDSALLKDYIVRELGSVTDADPDVLAEYILALLSSPDEATAAAKASCHENLKDFLGATSDKFVDDLFTAIAKKTYDPSQPPPKPLAPTYPPPRKTSIQHPREQKGSKKRTYHDWDRDESQNNHRASFESGERPMKQPRRGGRGTYDHQRGGRQQHHQHAQPQQPLFPPIPTPPPGMPQFDMNNPMAAFMAFQQAMTMLPGFPLASPNGNAFGLGQRCQDFDTKGFCTAGATCPFDHGENLYVVQKDENDSTQAALVDVQPSRTGVVKNSYSGQGRGSQRRRGGVKRAEISHQGPSYDRSLTTVVVEQIPGDMIQEEMVRDFFKDFGSIEEITMQPYKHLAIIKYSDYDSAKAAYDSPKAIFDNRFVKLYWYKPNSTQQEGQGLSQNKNGNGTHMDTEEQETQIDPDELARKQDEAQRKHEEQKKKREDTEAQKKELDAKVNYIDAERKKVVDAIAKKSGKAASPTTDEPGSDDPNGLRAQLAKLEAEAKSLGIDPNAVTGSYDPYSSTPQYHRGRGGFRGRSRGRGSYNPSFRGGWQGARGGAVMRLDNRPKTVAITFSEGSYDDHEESLRQWLLFNAPESAVLTKHPESERQDMALVRFTERYLGESFMAAAATVGFPLAGKAEMCWYKPAGQSTTSGAPNNMQTSNHSTSREVITDVQMEDEGPARHMDDVADDDDEWG